MWLYSRNYLEDITIAEQHELDAIRASEEHGALFGRINHYPEYPTAVKHHMSLFPNNHIDLHSMMKERDLHSINNEFKSLVHSSSVTERAILNFINHTPQAYHIIGSVFTRFPFGHHDAFIFPEFELGNDYRPDYLLVGSGSGGYQFIWVELEKSNGRISLAERYPGQVPRAGMFQISDWKAWIDSNFSELATFFTKEKNPDKDLPAEFVKYDSTRMHYVVVAGLREDYSDELNRNRRRIEQENGITMLHYDNLYDDSESLLANRNSF